MILVAGETVVDLVPDTESKNKNQFNYTAMLGGSPFNVALGLGRLGSKIGFSGNISNDLNGVRFLKSLENNGVENYSDIQTLPSTLAWTMRDKNKNMAYSFYLDKTALDEYQFNPSKKTLDELDAIFFGSIVSYWKHLGNQFLQTIKHIKKSHPNLLIAYDPNIRLSLMDCPKEKLVTIKKHLKQADVIKMSDEDFKFIFKSTDFKRITKKYLKEQVKLFVVTKGKDGCSGYHLVGKEINEITLPIYKTKLVDSIGGGDCFSATLLNGLFSEAKIKSSNDIRQLLPETIEFILRRALIGASMNCEHVGANPPNLKQLNERIKSFKLV